MKTHTQVPAHWVNDYLIDLPHVPEKQLAQAALFALEGQLAEPIEELYARAIRQSDGRVLVRVIQQARLDQLLTAKPLALFPKSDALPTVETPTLWQDDDFYYLARPNEPIRVFAPNLLALADIQLTPEPRPKWDNELINPDNNLIPPPNKPLKLWPYAFATAGFFFFTQFIEISYLKYQLKQFPSATVLTARGQNNHRLLTLLDTFGKKYQNIDYKINQITYQNKQLKIMFTEPGKEAASAITLGE